MRGYSIPRLISWRGAGLGNEIIPWGKALVAAHHLGLRAVHPAWALNPRGYRAEFETSRLDWLAQHAVSRVMPRVQITTDDVRASGASDYRDVLDAVLARRSLRGPVALEHASGMYGGYRSIQAARTLLLREFLRPRATAEALYAVGASANRGRLTVGLHVRAGDFDSSREIRPGVFNVAVPGRWYVSVAERLAAELGEDVEVLVISDGQQAALIDELRRVLPVVDLQLGRHTAVGDLVLLAACDVLVCSISSYSLAAAFLSDRPYIWFAPHLNSIDGWLSLWGHEEDQREGPTASFSRSDAAPGLVGRGIPLDWDDALPEHALDLLNAALLAKTASRDLIYFGAVRDARGRALA